MKESLTSFDLRVLVGELSGIEGSYLDKVYQKDSSFILKLNMPRVGRKELFIEPGRWIFLGQELEKPREPPPFTQSLRRALDNALLRDVRQRGFDRILLLDFEKETEYTIVLEMFGRGNLILLRDGIIQQALRYGKWRTREIRRGQPYAFPPEGVNPVDLSLGDFRNAVRGYRGPVVKALASGLNLGGLYSEEICLRAGVDKGVASKGLDDTQVETLYRELQGLVSQLDEPSPAMVIDERPIDVIPFDLQIYRGCEIRRFDTMSEALREYVKVLEPEVEEDEEVSRLERRIAKQEEVLREVKGQIADLERATDYIYAHYQEVDRLLRHAREGQIEDVDFDRGVVNLKVDGTEVELDISLNVDENARKLYERKKELVQRARRVSKAIKDSRAELERARETGKRREIRPAYKPSKRFWFDAYRWSLSSEGFLILAGRDARSNERLVRRHLEPGDRYVHADLPGAPSVVVKEGSKAGDGTLREACRLAVVYSKAWNLGLGSGSAYWVTPEQVSKTAESGEYLRTGSFVIRGKRNYVHNIPLALGVGEMSYQRVRRIAAADPDAIAKLSDAYVILEPGGKVERRHLVRLLSDAFQVPPDEIERLLPSGTFHVVSFKGIDLKLPED
jgi:predicted ribosome quality control (RQC) complex YloA/Tae2 family protein